MKQKRRLKKQLGIKTMGSKMTLSMRRQAGSATDPTNSRAAVRVVKLISGSTRAQIFGLVATKMKTLTFAKCALDGAYTARKTIKTSAGLIQHRLEKPSSTLLRTRNVNHI